MKIEYSKIKDFLPLWWIFENLVAKDFKNNVLYTKKDVLKIFEKYGKKVRDRKMRSLFYECVEFGKYRHYIDSHKVVFGNPETIKKIRGLKSDKIKRTLKESGRVKYGFID